MKNINQELFQIIEDSPSVAIAMQNITAYIMTQYPMEVDGYYDLENAKVTTHWQHIIFEQVLFGADYINQVEADSDTDAIAKQGANQMKQNPTDWYNWNYQPLNKSELKSIIKTEFAKSLTEYDCMDDWDQVEATDILNAELALN